jgi:hypothetical protein
MDALITASVGLYHDANDMYYLQVITAQHQNNYLLEIPRREAFEISANDQVEITDVGESLSHHPNLIGHSSPYK